MNVCGHHRSKRKEHGQHKTSSEAKKIPNSDLSAGHKKGLFNAKYFEMWAKLKKLEKCRNCKKSLKLVKNGKIIQKWT